MSDSDITATVVFFLTVATIIVVSIGAYYIGKENGVVLACKKSGGEMLHGECVIVKEKERLFK